MSHEVENMVSVREVPWHGLGTIVEETLTAKEALVLAGLDWNVTMQPIFAAVQDRVVVTEHDHETGESTDILGSRYVEIPGQFATVRDSDSSILGTVSSRYKPVQNHEAFDFFDGVVDNGEAKYETAGSLQGGKRIFLTAKVPDGVQIGGVDQCDFYIVLATSHDASLALTMMVTPIRVVCQNTLNLSLSGAKQKWSVRHNSGIDAKIAAARDGLDLTFAYRDAFAEEMNRLIDTEVTKAQFETMVSEVFPGKTSVGSAFTPEQYALIGVFESSTTIDDSFRNTAWGALNAVREFDDWKPRNGRGDTSEAEARTTASWFGSNVGRSNKVLDYLQEAVVA